MLYFYQTTNLPLADASLGPDILKKWVIKVFSVNWNQPELLSQSSAGFLVTQSYRSSELATWETADDIATAPFHFSKASIYSWLTAVAVDLHELFGCQAKQRETLGVFSRE